MLLLFIEEVAAIQNLEHCKNLAVFKYILFNIF